MATYKRVAGDYTIQTFGTSNVTFQSNVANAVTVVIDGNLSVTGNATLTGNISGDRLFNGSTSIEIPNAGGNANISVGGVSNVAVFTSTGLVVTGLSIPGGDFSAANITASGYMSAVGNISSSSNINAYGNVFVTNNATTKTPTVRFVDNATSQTSGIVLGALEWYTSDTTGSGPRVTSSIRSIAADNGGNANVQILTNTGGSLTTKLVILSDGNVGVANNNPTTTFGVTGTGYFSGNLTSAANVQSGNLLTTGLISATSNVTTGANLLVSGYANITGNVTGANLITAGIITASGNITSPANIRGGNLASDGGITAINDIGTNGNLSVQGNVTSGANIAGNNISAGNNVNTINLTASGAVAATGNVSGSNITGTGILSVTGTATVGNVLTAGLISSAGNITSASNVAGTYFIGNGAFLSGLSTAFSTSTIANGTSFIDIPGSGSSIDVGVGGFGVATILTTGINVTGTVSSSGNVTGGNLITAGSATAIGNVVGGNLITLGVANITTANIGTLFVTNINANSLTSGTVSTDRLTGTYTINISGNASGTSATITTNAQPNITSVGILTSLSVSGNVDGGNLRTAGLVTATGNVTGGNIISAANITATGNVTGTFFLGNGSLLTGIAAGYANSNVAAYLPTYTGAMTAMTGNLATTANITGGNILTAGIISATGNITGGNILGGANVNATTHTGTTVSVTGNVSGGNILATTALLGASVSVSGNATSGNVNTGGLVTATGNIVTGANAVISGYANVTGNITGANLITAGSTGGLFVNSITHNGTNAVGNIGGTGGYFDQVFAATYNGTTLSTVGNVTGGNINTGGVVSSSGTIVATGNITGGNLTTAGVLTVNSGAAATAIVNGAGNAVGNIGSSSSYFNRLFATATTALYADLAEKYTADAEYPPGTVVSFGGDSEITLSVWDSDRRVAGVVSTNPSYLMNAGLDSKHVAIVALQGRVPCQVQGPVRKGDMLVSNGNGAARSEADPKTGAVIGKALENFSGESGTIEVVVGRI